MLGTNSITSTGARDEFFDGVLQINSTSQWNRPLLSLRHSTEEAPLWAIFSALLNMALDARQAANLLHYQSPATNAILTHAQSALRQVSNRVLAKEVEQVLNELEQILIRIDAAELPPIHLFELESGGLFLEWVLPDRRAGISFEPDSSDSGWYLIASGMENHKQAWGYLTTLDLHKVVSHMQQKVTV